MKIYTKRGDTGETGLFGGLRLRKDAPRIEAYGEVDELNSVLGMVRAASVETAMDQLLHRIQNELFDLGAELATPDAAARGKVFVRPAMTERLESAIDRYEETLSPLTAFILPGGSAAAAALHLARTVCRRAERRVITLAHLPDEAVSAEIIVYLNRLSDLLFVLARAANQAAGQADVPWQKATD